MKEGWEIKKLGDVCDKIFAGGDKPKNYSKFKTDEFKIPIFANGEKNKGLYGFTDFAKVTKPSITISARGTIGYSKIRKEPFTPIVRLIVLNPNETDVKIEFLKYVVSHMDFKNTGSSIPQLTVPMVKDYTFPLPPLKEQQQIVVILDKAFTAIDKAKANAEQNLLNAKQLFESYLQNVFTNKSEDWEEKRFDEICVLQRGFDLPTRLREEGEYPLVSSNGITDYVNIWKVKSPGVSTGRSGTIGKVHFIEKDYFPLNTSLYIKEFYGNDEKCIFYFLKQFDLSRFQSGAGVPTLNRNNVHSIKVFFPKSIQEQQKIVKKLDALQTQTKKLEILYQQKIADLEELKKSVLQKAFSGELTQKELV